MKKNKLITISILASLLLVPFMIPAAKAAPASYVGIAEGEYYEYFMDIDFDAWTSSGFFTDGMSDTIGNLFSTPASDRLAVIWGSWEQWDLASWWGRSIDTILPENTSDILLADYGIPDNITYTEINTDVALWHIYGSEPGWAQSHNIGNDSNSFALLSLYGGWAFSPMTLAYVTFAPNNMDWNVFAATAQLGMTNFHGAKDPLAANTTVTALADGYSLYVPIAGFENNTKSITVNATYGSSGALNYTSFEYGADLLYTYVLNIYSPDAADPVITDSPSNFAVEEGYTGESISWTATDAHPGNYTITRDSTPVVTPTPWTNGTEVTYNIPDGLTQGIYTFEITFEDMYSNSISETVNLTVYIPDTTDPVITSAPADITKTLSPGDLGEIISWTATDPNAATYIIKINGTIEVFATPWVSGTPVTYYAYYVTGVNATGVTTVEITFSDFAGNSVSDSVTMTISPIPETTPETTPPPGIPGFEPMIVIGIVAIGSIGLIVLKKKKK